MGYEEELSVLTDYEKEVFNFATQKGFLSITKCMKRPFLLRIWSMYTNEKGLPYAVIHLGHRYSDITVVPKDKQISQGLRERLEEVLKGAPGTVQISPSDVHIKMIPRNKAHKIMTSILEVLSQLEEEGPNPEVST